MKISKNKLRGVESIFLLESEPAHWGPRLEGRDSGGLFDRFHKHYLGMRRIVSEAKRFLQDNWEKVEDWSDLKIIIHDNKGSHIYYDNDKAVELRRASEEKLKEANKDSIMKGMFDGIHEHQGHWHDPVRSVSNVVLDESDGDFSIDINGKGHLWIDDNAVMVLAYYVEKRVGWKLAAGEPK